jgi:hypothetical protein
MGLFFGSKKLQFAPFPIGVFGKLPFYKDFLHCGFGEGFAEIRECFDQGFDALTRAKHPRPYVAPMRRLFFAMPRLKGEFVASIWESDDGLRGFPFLIVAPFPRKLRQASMPQFWQALTCFWQYFDRYFSHLAQSSDPGEFYAKVRGRVHTLPPHPIEPWPADPAPAEARLATDLLQVGRLAPLLLSDLDEAAERSLLQSLQISENPAFILWPGGSWRSSGLGKVYAYLGPRGLEDLNFEFFLPEREETQPKEADLHTAATLPGNHHPAEADTEPGLPLPASNPPPTGSPAGEEPTLRLVRGDLPLPPDPPAEESP